jgi:hypothetical protein
MKLNIKDISIADIIALMIIGGGLYLMSQGINGTVSIVLTMVVGFYFGNKFTR